MTRIVGGCLNMSNHKGGNYPVLGFKLPEGWVVVKQHRGITTIKPISEVESHHLTRNKQLEGVI